MKVSCHKNHITLIIALFIAMAAVIPTTCFAAGEQSLQPVTVTATMLDAVNGLVIFSQPVSANAINLKLNVDDTKVFVLTLQGQELYFTLPAPLVQPSRITITGVSAIKPNLQAISLNNILLMPAVWPASRSKLVFLWELSTTSNLVLFPDNNSYTPCKLAINPTLYDEKGRFKCNLGTTSIDEALSKTALTACKTVKSLSFELTYTPGGTPVNTNLFTIGNVTVRQEGYKLLLAYPGDKPGTEATIPLKTLTESTISPMHLLVSINPKQMAAYLNGTSISTVKLAPNWFSRWTDTGITAGSPTTEATPQCVIEAIAIYSRTLTTEDAKNSAAAAIKRLTPWKR